MHTTQQNPNTKNALKFLPATPVRRWSETNTPPALKRLKWGFVENTWEDKQFQEADWNAFVEKAMEGDPWEGHDGKQAF